MWKYWWWCACSVLFIVSWLSLGRRVEILDQPLKCAWISFCFRNWGLWMRILCRRPATYQQHPAWFPPPLTFLAPRHSQVGCLSSIVTKKGPKRCRQEMLCSDNTTIECFFNVFKANAGGSGRDALQSARQPEESATAGASAASTLPGQYKQRTPMYNAGNTTNPATPTSPSTPVSTPASNGPPAAATASQQDTPSQPPTTPQTPTPTPAPTPPQPQPKKNLSLTVRRMRLKHF